MLRYRTLKTSGGCFEGKERKRRSKYFSTHTAEKNGCVAVDVVGYADHAKRSVRADITYPVS